MPDKVPKKSMIKNQKSLPAMYLRLRRLFRVFGLAVVSASVAFSAKGQIFVVNGGRIDEFSTSGATVSSDLIQGLLTPFGIAADSAGQLFVSYQQESPLESVVGTYTFSGTSVDPVMITGPYNDSVKNLALDGLGDIYVANPAGTVGEYTTSGTPVNASLITGLNSPGLMALDGLGHLYVEQTVGITSTINEYSSSGSLIKANWLTFPNGQGPSGLAADNAGQVFVSFNSAVVEYSTSGTLLNASLIPGLSAPAGLTVSGQDLYVTDPGTGSVGEYTTSGGVIDASLVTGLDDPFEIAVVPEPTVTMLGFVGMVLLFARLRKCPRSF